MEYKTNTEGSNNDNSQIAIVRQKIVCVGDVSVGKTSIINSFLESKFKEVYEVFIFFIKKAFCWSGFFHENHKIQGKKY